MAGFGLGEWPFLEPTLGNVLVRLCATREVSRTARINVQSLRNALASHGIVTMDTPGIAGAGAEEARLLSLASVTTPPNHVVLY